jgi:hypothetical protein
MALLSNNLNQLNIEVTKVENQWEQLDSYIQMDLLYVYLRVHMYVRARIMSADTRICTVNSTGFVWCPGQNKRIAPLSFFHGCRKRRLKD